MSTPSTVQYSEKLYPSLTVWAIVLLVGASGYLVFAPINLTIGLISSFIITAALVTIIIVTTPKLLVDPLTVQAGRATIEKKYIGEVKIYSGEQARQEKGINLHGNAYMLFRGGIKSVVKIQILDPDDPHPYWLISSRHPEQFKAAVETP